MPFISFDSNQIHEQRPLYIKIINWKLSCLLAPFCIAFHLIKESYSCSDEVLLPHTNYIRNPIFLKQQTCNCMYCNTKIC